MHYDFKEIYKKVCNAKIDMFGWALDCGLSECKDLDRGNMYAEMLIWPSEKFHDYPYQEYYETAYVPSARKLYPDVTNQCALELEYVLNRDDANDTMRYLCALIKKDTEEAEEIKTQIQIKMAKRRAGLVDENHPDPAVAAIRKAYNIGRAQGRNIFDPRDSRQTSPQSQQQAQTIPPGYRIVNGVTTDDGRSVILTDEMFHQLMEQLKKDTLNNSYGRLDLSAISDEDEIFETAPEFQQQQVNQPQFQPQQNQFQQPSIYQPVFIQAGSGQALYSTRDESQSQPQVLTPAPWHII